MLIAFTGPGSSGKTTLQNLMKRDYPQFEYVDNTTRTALEMGLQINEQGSVDTQLFILNNHFINSFKHNAVLNRCIIDGLVYTEQMHVDYPEKFDWVYKYACNLYDHLLPKYDLIFYTVPHGMKYEDDKVRSTNTLFTDAIQNRFYRLVYDVKNLIRLEGSVEDRYSLIKDKLKDYGIR